MERDWIGERWGTWEELLLGGAVLRHGTSDWNVVALELRPRIVCPYTCTPEICKAKYEDLRQRYVGCSGWYEELRQQRIIELRQALENSADSIGSLESKLEALKSKNGDGFLVNSSSQSESWGGVEKPSRFEKFGGILYESNGVTVRKRRGKRKRKDVKEGSIGENNLSETANLATVSLSKENSCCNSFEVLCGANSDGNEGNKSLSLNGAEAEALMAVFNSVAENQSASVFCRRLDSQKRGRYKKIIRQHLDLNSISSRIASHSITTHTQLYRDLLLLANNALAFYSLTTREHKSALLLRRLLTATFRHNPTAATCHNQRVSMENPGDDNLSRKEGDSEDVRNSNGSRRRRRSNANSHPQKGLTKKRVDVGNSLTKKGAKKGVVGNSKIVASAIPPRGRKRGRKTK